MAKHQKAYTEEFKREAVRLMASSGKAIAEVARDLGVNDSVLYRWRATYEKQAGGGKDDAPAQVADLEAEVKRLRRELETVRQERDILKKAISIFSRSQP